jgi:Mn2+/Fe2+ NRAMP family transporter
MARPHWGDVMHQMVAPNLRNVFAVRTAHFRSQLGGISPFSAYVLMIINVVGTTITPWGQFYIQSSVRDKGVRPEEYGYTRLDVLFGAFFTNFIAFFIIVCCGATLFPMLELNDAGDAAKALAPLAGPLAATLFAIGLFNASCFGAITVPLSTAYAVTEALGSESGLGRRIREAPLFIGTFTFLIAASAVIVVAVPADRLGFLITLPNYVGGLLLPIILVLMQLLVNKRRLMGNYVNSRGYNALAWVTTSALIVLSVLAAWAALRTALPGASSSAAAPVAVVHRA